MSAGGEEGAPDPATAPLFVLGADHSGTTILYRMLAHHPDLVWLSQFSLRDGEIPGRAPRPLAGLRDSAARRLPHPWTKEDSGLVRRLVPHPGEEPEVWAYLLEDEATGPERVRTTLTGFSRRLGGRRLLAKRPGFYRHLDLLRRAFPAAGFIHIVRDGRAVAMSLRDKRMRTRGDTGADASLEQAARFWVEVVERVGTTPGLDPYEVRYEDFCGDVHGILSAILGCFGLDSARFPFARLPRTLEVSNGRWLDAASPEELAPVSAIQEPLLRHYGYRLDPKAGLGTSS